MATRSGKEQLRLVENTTQTPEEGLEEFFREGGPLRGTKPGGVQQLREDLQHVPTKSDIDHLLDPNHHTPLTAEQRAQARTFVSDIDRISGELQPVRDVLVQKLGMQEQVHTKSPHRQSTHIHSRRHRHHGRTA